MALSANAARALEQVKMGLYMLYGAAYFTEDEWIKIDSLIHKGQYVFTRGPQNNLLEEGELISFERSIKEQDRVSHSKYTKEESCHSTELYEGEVAPLEQTNEDVYLSPIQQETRIQSWTSQVKTQESSAPEIVSPKPKNGNPDHRLEAGKIFIAQRAAEKKSKIGIKVRPGDHIKILKHVSGIMHLGLNLSTKQTGQFPESIFTLAPGVSAKQEALIEQQRALATATQTGQVALRTRVQDVGTANRLDRVEGMNAAEWEAEESPVLKQQEITSTTTISKEEISRLVNEKFAQIMAAQAATSAALNNHKPRPRSKTPLKEPLKPVNPKTETCWFWATPNKECRFTADECRDLHAFLPVSLSDPTNLRMGKPTWGALADSLPTPSHIEYAPGKASKTCFYWATEGKCEFTAWTCECLHAHLVAGVASDPRDRVEKACGWECKCESNWDDGNGWGNRVEVPEFVLEEVQSGP